VDCHDRCYKRVKDAGLARLDRAHVAVSISLRDGFARVDRALSVLDKELGF
jgi:hypothetical protein